MPITITITGTIALSLLCASASVCGGLKRGIVAAGDAWLLLLFCLLLTFKLAFIFTFNLMTLDFTLTLALALVFTDSGLCVGDIGCSLK